METLKCREFQLREFS